MAKGNNHPDWRDGRHPVCDLASIDTAREPLARLVSNSIPQNGHEYLANYSN